MVKEKQVKQRKGKKNDVQEFEAEERTLYFDLFKQLKQQFYKDKGERSTLEALKDSLGGAVLKDVTHYYQKLNKKSTETVVKTLREFHSFLETKPDDFFLALITSYTIIHEKLLTTEFSRDIFGNLLKIDELIITRNRNAIKLNFKSFYPAWFLMQYESQTEVRRQAMANLDLLFPDSDKQATAFVVSYPNYLALIHGWLTSPANQFKDINLFLDDDDCERVHGRLLGLTFRSLDGSLLLIAENEERDAYYERVKALLRFEESGNLIVELFTNLKKDFSSRAELAHLYLTMCKCGIEDFTSKQSPNIIKTFVSNIDAKEPLLQKVFWENGLMVTLLEGILLKPEQQDLPKMYKRLQSILELGSMGIGIKFFESFNHFILQTPLLNFGSYPNAKKFTGALGDTLKQIEAFLTSYLRCLELDICKFYMADLVDQLFDLVFEILVNCVLKTRSAIKKGELYPAKDLTEPMLKNIETCLDKLVDILLLLPLHTYLDRNDPDHTNELQVGVNNYKYLPRGFAKLLGRLIGTQDLQYVVENKDLLERTLQKFAAEAGSYSKDKKKFESFLFLIDHLAKAKIDSGPKETESLSQIVTQMFKASSQFVEDFAQNTFDAETIEKVYKKDEMDNFRKYLSNILASESDLNRRLCEIVVPQVISKVIDTLCECLDDQFDLFDSEAKRLEIIQQMMAIFLRVQEWRQKTNQVSLEEVDAVFSKLKVHIIELQAVDDSMIASKAAHVATIIAALTPNVKLISIGDTLRQSKEDLKEVSVEWAEKNSGFSMAIFDGMKQSSEFRDVIQMIQTTFLRGKNYTSMILYDTSRRFMKYLDEPFLLKLLSKALSSQNSKDEYIGYKLAAVESRILDLSDENKKEFSFLLFSYIDASKSFSSTRTVCKLEKFMQRLDQPSKCELVISLTSLLIHPENKFKNTEGDKTSKAVDLVTLLNFFLKQLTDDEDMTNDTAQTLIDIVLVPELYRSGALSQIYLWLVVKAVLQNCKAQVDLKEVFGSFFDKPDYWVVIYCFLAAPACLQIVLMYDIRRFLMETTSNAILPVIINAASESSDAFLKFIDGAINLACTEDIQFIYGLKRLLLSLSGDDSIESCTRERIFEQVVRSLEYQASKVKDDSLSNLVEVSSNVLSYFNRNLLKESFVVEYKLKIKSDIKSELDISDQRDDFVEKETFQALIDYSKTDPVKLVFRLSVYLNLCRGSKNNKIAELKMLAFDLTTAQKFTSIKREVLLTLVFKLMNIAIEDGELERFSEKIEQIESLYSEGLQLSSFGAQKNLLLVAMLEFLRKVLGVLEMFSQEFEASIHTEIMNLAVSKVRALKDAKFDVNPVFTKDDSATQYGCGFDELLIEIAETMSRFSLSQKANVKEEDLYVLLNCEVPVIQKSAFVVLSDYYENKISPIPAYEDIDISDTSNKTTEHLVSELLRVLESRAISSEEAQGQKAAKKKQTKETSEILEIKDGKESRDLDLFGYILTWIQLMFRIKSARLDASAEQRYYETTLTLHPELYYGFLKYSFKWIQGLKLPGKEFEKRIENINIAEMPMYWIDYVSKDAMLELILHAFYKFSSGFPKFLRNWVRDADKKYTIMADQIIKSKVSNLILDYEIQQIDNKEPSKHEIIQYGEVTSFR